MHVRSLLRSGRYAALLLVFGAGCSSSGTAVPPPSQQSNTAAPTATVTFTITPGAATTGSSIARKPAYLSTLTQSVTIVPVEPGQPAQAATIVNVQAGATGCVGSGTTLACTGTVKAPVGQTSFTVSTFSQLNGTGSLLSVGTITLTVTASGGSSTISNPTSLTLSGVPASFTLALSPPTITLGNPATVVADVTSYDAAGAIIIAPGTYATPIDIETITPFGVGPVLSENGSNNAPPGCTYSTPATSECHVVGFANSPAQPVSLSYSGTPLSASSITIVAEAPGLTSQTATLALATPNANSCVGSPISVCPALVSFASPSSAAIPLTVTEAGVSTFRVDATVCSNLQIATVNFASSSNGSSFSIEPGLAAGNCVLTVSDSTGNTTNINVTLLASATPPPSPSPTPIATANPTPTPVPTGAITIAPTNSLVFASSTAAPQKFTASETGTPTFTIDQSNCSGVATVSPASGTSFTVTPVATLTQGGSCTIVVSDAKKQTSNVGVTVDGVSFVIQ